TELQASEAGVLPPLSLECCEVCSCQGSAVETHNNIRSQAADRWQNDRQSVLFSAPSKS
ncbi:hypothetical protein KI387_002750, partial [Taxus chinensis]